MNMSADQGNHFNAVKQRGSILKATNTSNFDLSKARSRTKVQSITNNVEASIIYGGAVNLSDTDRSFHKVTYRAFRPFDNSIENVQRLLDKAIKEL